jgi:hypothetical protein
VDTVLVDGRVVMAGRRVLTVEEDAVLDDATREIGLALDRTGNGAWLAERTMQRYGAHRVEGIHLTEGWYRDHMPKLKAAFQDASFDIPADAQVVEDFRAILPKGTRVYIAHIDGTPIEEMVATAKRIGAEGFDVMPHFPARIIKDRATLTDWVARYKDVGVRQGLLLAGGVFSREQLEAYMALKWEEVYAYEHTPHPVEYAMYYSC